MRHCRLAFAAISDQATRSMLQTELRTAGWQVLPVDGAEHFTCARLPPSVSLILCELGDDPFWREKIAQLAALPSRPFVIALSACAPENLWDDAVRCGASDVISLPASPDAVLKACESLWKIRQAQQALRAAVLRNQSLANGIKDKLRNAVDIQLSQNVTSVCLHRVRTQVQQVCHFLVRLAFRH